MRRVACRHTGPRARPNLCVFASPSKEFKTWKARLSLGHVDATLALEDDASAEARARILAARASRRNKRSSSQTSGFENRRVKVAL